MFIIISDEYLVLYRYKNEKQKLPHCRNNTDIKIIDNIATPNTQIHCRPFVWVGTGTSIKRVAGLI